MNPSDPPINSTAVKDVAVLRAEFEGCQLRERERLQTVAERQQAIVERLRSLEGEIERFREGLQALREEVVAQNVGLKLFVGLMTGVVAPILAVLTQYLLR